MAAFLSLIGSKTYSLLRNVVSPTRPQEKSYKDLVEVPKAHYEPKHIVIAERFHFYRRAQARGESISEYITWLSFADCQRTVSSGLSLNRP